MRPTGNPSALAAVYAAMVRDRRFLAIPIAAMLSLAAGSAVSALSCIGHDDVREAAREVVAGEHPGWADGYVIGRIELVEENGLEPIVLTVRPTHVFGDELPAQLRLAARQDGPPDPGSWRAGSLWFLALEADDPIDGTDALVAPCAPNFEVTDADEIDALVAVGVAVDVRDPDLADGSTDDRTTPIVYAGLAVALVGAASLVAFRRRSNGRSAG